MWRAGWLQNSGRAGSGQVLPCAAASLLPASVSESAAEEAVSKAYHANIPPTRCASSAGQDGRRKIRNRKLHWSSWLPTSTGCNTEKAVCELSTRF